MQDIKTIIWESKLAIALVLLVISRCVDRVLYTRLTFEYTSYLWYLSNVILPIAFIVSSWPVVWYKLYFTSEITPEMRAFPHYKYAIMALFDALFNLLSAFPTPHIGGNMANILSQVNLPLNMVLAMIFLGTRYQRCHILGAILVIYGSFVNLIPIFNGDEAVNSPDPTFGWISLYIVAMIPAAASNVYKEIGLKDVDLDIWYVNAWVSFYQLFWGLLTIWTIRFKAFCDPPVPWSEFLDYVGEAHDCFLGTPVNTTGVYHPCNEGTFNTFIYFIIFNLIYNQLMLYIFREGSSVLFVVSSAVGLPLTDVLYLFPFLSGTKGRQNFTIYDGFALFVLVVALLVYHSEKEYREKGSTKLMKSPMYSSPTLQRTRLMKKGGRGMITYRQSPSPSPRSKRTRASRSPSPSSRQSLLRNQPKGNASAKEKYGAILNIETKR